MRSRLIRQIVSGPSQFAIGAQKWQVRYVSTTHSHHTKPTTGSLNPRWLSETKERLGKCMTFGLTTPQLQEAGSILQELAQDWRGLVAGSEGFLTEEHRRGLYRQEVVWGEMVRRAPSPI